MKLPQPAGVKLIAFADDVAVVITAKYLEEIEATFDSTFAGIQRWIRTVGLTQAEHKTEAVLVTSRKIIETITLTVGGPTITSQPYIRYLGVMIDPRLDFKHHIEVASS